MDPGEDIIDVLYNRAETSQSSKSSGSSMLRRSMLQRQYSNGIYQYGFEYQHPPTRNYYEDLFQIQRRNFHGSDSVYETANIAKRPLCRSDSVMNFYHPFQNVLDNHLTFYSLLCKNQITNM